MDRRRFLYSTTFVALGTAIPGTLSAFAQSQRTLTARPEYYGLLLFTEAGGSRMIGSDLHAPGLAPLLTAYGVRSGDGTLKAVVFNKNADRDADLTLNAGHRVERAEMLRLAGPSLEDTQGVTLGGVEVGAGGAWAEKRLERVSVREGKAVCHIPAASAALLSLG